MSTSIMEPEAALGTEDSRGKESGVPLRILARMMDGDRFDTAAITQEFSVSTGTALRYLKLLERWVPGVERDTSAKRHIYRFNRSYLRDTGKRDGPMHLANAIAISLASAFSKLFINSHYQTSLLELRNHLLKRLPVARRSQFRHVSRKFVTLGGFEEALSDRSGLLDDVLDAVLKSKQLAIEYEKFGDGRRVETRTIEPYTLAIHDSHFYVVGVNSGSPPSELRTFRFSRILTADVLDTSFNYPAPTEYDPESAFRDSIGVWSSRTAPVSVRVRLASKWQVMAEHHRWHSSQRVQRCETGEVELTFLVRPCPEFEKWILGFGEDAEVLEPLALRDKIAQRLSNACHAYMNE